MTRDLHKPHVPAHGRHDYEGPAILHLGHKHPPEDLVDQCEQCGTDIEQERGYPRLVLCASCIAKTVAL